MFTIKQPEQAFRSKPARNFQRARGAWRRDALHQVFAARVADGSLHQTAYGCGAIMRIDPVVRGMADEPGDRVGNPVLGNTAKIAHGLSDNGQLLGRQMRQDA